MLIIIISRRRAYQRGHFLFPLGSSTCESEHVVRSHLRGQPAHKVIFRVIHVIRYNMWLDIYSICSASRLITLIYTHTHTHTHTHC